MFNFRFLNAFKIATFLNLLIIFQVEINDERKIPQFVLLVSLDLSRKSASEGERGRGEGEKGTPNVTIRETFSPKSSDITQGWAVQRNLDEFYSLHEKLTQVSENNT